MTRFPFRLTRALNVLYNSPIHHAMKISMNNTGIRLRDLRFRPREADFAQLGGPISDCPLDRFAWDASEADVTSENGVVFRNCNVASTAENGRFETVRFPSFHRRCPANSNVRQRSESPTSLKILPGELTTPAAPDQLEAGHSSTAETTFAIWRARSGGTALPT